MDALTATTYGRVLMVKLVGVTVLVLLGNLARLCAIPTALGRR